MPFIQPTIIDDAHRLRPGRVATAAPIASRIIGDMAVDAGTATQSTTAANSVPFEVGFAQAVAIAFSANTIDGIYYWEAATAGQSMRAYDCDRIIGDMVGTITTAGVGSSASSGVEAQFENATAGTIVFSTVDQAFLAYWEVATGYAPFSAVDVIVQIGDVAIQVNQASLDAIAPLLNSLITEFSTAGQIVPTANDATWLAVWESSTATLVIRAKQVDAIVGDMSADALGVALAIAAPLVSGTEAPLADAGVLIITAPSLGFEVTWTASAGAIATLANTITALISDQFADTGILTLTINANGLTPFEVGLPTTCTLEFVPYSIDYYSYLDAFTAQISCVAPNLGEAIATGVTPYDASVQFLDPGEADVNLSDWEGWVG